MKLTNEKKNRKDNASTSQTAHTDRKSEQLKSVRCDASSQSKERQSERTEKHAFWK